MPLTATHINYNIVCQRKLWLFSHDVVMEQTSDVVFEGKLIGENSYTQRAERYTEIAMQANFQGIRKKQCKSSLL
jgi:CRISPR-associated exonuclease Cas4